MQPHAPVSYTKSSPAPCRWSACCCSHPRPLQNGELLALADVATAPNLAITGARPWDKFVLFVVDPDSPEPVGWWGSCIHVCAVPYQTTSSCLNQSWLRLRLPCHVPCPGLPEVWSGGSLKHCCPLLATLNLSQANPIYRSWLHGLWYDVSGCTDQGLSWDVLEGCVSRCVCMHPPGWQLSVDCSAAALQCTPRWDATDKQGCMPVMSKAQQCAVHSYADCRSPQTAT